MQPRYTREPILPELEPEPEPEETYNSRIVKLRTSLGRAAIALELRGVTRDVIRSSACDVPYAHRVQAGCARCELAGEGDPFDSALLDAFVVAFNRYPGGVLQDTHIESVALCKTIIDEEAPKKRSAGTVDLRSRRLFLSIAPFLHREYDATGSITAEDIVHHELFHQFEYERMNGAYTDDREWRDLNPLDFSYRDGADDDPRQPGFINPYAAVADTEDRASMFQYLLARPDELCAIAEEDVGVRVKTRLLWRRIAAIVNDEFLRQRATCVLPWLDRNETAPARAQLHEPALLKLNPYDGEHAPSRDSLSRSGSSPLR